MVIIVMVFVDSYILESPTLISMLKARGLTGRDHIKLEIHYPNKAVLIGALVILLIIITICHVWSFILAYRAVHSRPTDADVAVQSKKNLRLIILFIIMYVIFIIGFAPLLYAIGLDENHNSLSHQTLLSVFMLTSILNPAFTLCLKGDFRLMNLNCKLRLFMSQSENTRLSRSGESGETDSRM